MRDATKRVLSVVAAALVVARPAVAGPVPAPGILVAAHETAHARRDITLTLVGLGYMPACAEQMTSRLTAEDVAVFAAHPEMLQVAGTRDLLNEAYFIAALIVIGIVVIAANGSASVMVN